MFILNGTQNQQIANFTFHNTYTNFSVIIVYPCYTEYMKVMAVLAVIAINSYATETYVCTGSDETYYCRLITPPEPELTDSDYVRVYEPDSQPVKPFRQIPEEEDVDDSLIFGTYP